MSDPVTITKRILTGSIVVIAAGCLGSLRGEPAGNTAPKLLRISSVTVGGKTMAIHVNGKVNLGTDPENIAIHFEPTTNWDKAPTRLRYRLEGYDNGWREGNCEMYVTVRFFNNTGDPVNQTIFRMRGESAGWNGSIKTSALTHRRESLVVPPQASRLMLVISSAGPPATEGVYVVANLTVTKKMPGATLPVTLLESPFDEQPDSEDLAQAPPGWTRDGTHASMAKIVMIGHDPAVRAFAIYDDDPFSHAEWRNQFDAGPKVSPGDNLTLEWNEMYSMGVGDTRVATYNSLKAGQYVFDLEEVNIFGTPTGVRTSVDLIVPLPFWRTAWFWGVVSFGVAALIFGMGRYWTWHKMRREMLRLKGQQALEQERLRIAHDIHDDLGARITEISLLSAMAEDNPLFAEKARVEFGRVSQMCRELVFALYETVWAVNPENDNLDALVNYLCQMVNRLCERSQFRCRFYVSELPRNVVVSSNTRHNVSMTVKEAVHNVIKHANATEVDITIKCEEDVLSISVHDDGRGFEVGDRPAGHGLGNMRRRLAAIGGECSIESQAGTGTTIYIRLSLKSAGMAPAAATETRPTRNLSH